MNSSENQLIGILALIAAGILLNLGLFFVLAILAPLVVGIVCGYLSSQWKDGVFISFVASTIAYSLIFAVTQLLPGFTTDLFAIVIAVLIMSTIGVIGGILGSIIKTRRTS